MKEVMLQTIESIVSDGAKKGVGHLVATDEVLHLPAIHIHNKTIMPFTLCDYLGLSQDERVKAGAIDLIQRYGTYTAVSRAFMSIQPIQDTESLLSRIFGGKPVAISPRTTLAHLAVLPVITHVDDAIVLDHQVHTSVKNAADQLKSYGNFVEVIRHSRMDQLEQRIQKLSQTHKRVWYFADGVYSMYGDTLPVEALQDLLKRYPTFHIYVDDAHGTSWTGKNGSGFIFESLAQHDRVFMVTSLGKGFGSGGAAIICPNERIKERIIYCGSPFIFTSPAEPGMLGAIQASALIHLSDELPVRQRLLMERITFFRDYALELGLPLLEPNALTPIFFIGVGKPEVGYELCQEMMKAGYFLSIGVYPAVPVNNTGMRATVTLLHDQSQIKGMLDTMKALLPDVLANHNSSMDKVYKYFSSKANLKQQEAPTLNPFM